MFNRYIPFSLPDIRDDEIKEVVDTLKSGWLTTGPKVQRFEEEFSKYIGAEYAVAVNSCTAALHLSLVVAGIMPEDEVITSPLTFCSTVNIIVHRGARPVFADVRDDFNIDPDKIERRITSRTKAIIPVHYAGQPCAMDEIMELARRYDLTVIEDAAHTVGARYKDKTIGTIGDTTCFSFYATKNMTTGEGGMVTTKNKKLSEGIRTLSLHGMSKGAWMRYTDKGSWYYEVIDVGFKYNMMDLQAALGIHQLKKLEDFIKTRTKYVRIYNDAFTEIPEILIPIVNPDLQHVWHLYVIRLKLDLLKISRTEFIENLKEKKISTSVHFIPVHLFPFYRRNYGFKPGDYPNAERIYEQVISLPLYPKMNESDVNYVVESVKEIIDRYRK